MSSVNTSPALPSTPRNKVLCGYANLAVGQIHYRAVAGTGPAIVFLHQTAISSASYQEVLECIDLPNPLVALDTPGFGGSFDPPGWPTMAQYAEQLVAALDLLGHHTFHLFGQHTGSSLALEIAARHPARALSLMLLGAVSFTAEERAAFRGEFNQPISPKPDGSHLLQNWQYAFENNPGCTTELIHREVVNMARAWKGRPQAYTAVSHHDTLGLLRATPLPLLFVSAPGDWFHDRLQTICALRPDAEVAIVDGDNFAPQRDSAGVARAIERFVARVTSNAQIAQ